MNRRGFLKSILAAGRFPKQYGLVTHAGKRFYRNYGRELKNGKGLDWIDVVNAKMYADVARLTAITPLFTGLAPRGRRRASRGGSS